MRRAKQWHNAIIPKSAAPNNGAERIRPRQPNRGRDRIRTLNVEICGQQPRLAERFASNLLSEGKVVVEAPLLHDASILDSEDRQLVDLNTTTAGGHARERTEMSARRVISNGHSVFIYDNVVDVLAPVRKAGTEPLDCPSNTVVPVPGWGWPPTLRHMGDEAFGIHLVDRPGIAGAPEVVQALEEVFGSYTEPTGK